MKWSLRTSFLFITLVAVGLAWKYNERARLIAATNQVVDSGGEVSYRWQKSTAVAVTRAFMGAYVARPRTYTVQLEDGTTTTRTTHETWRATSTFPVSMHMINHLSSDRSATESWASMFNGSDDVAVEVVSVDAKDVDEKFVDELCDLIGLKIVLLRRERQYNRVYASHSRFHEVEQDQLDQERKKLNEPFVRASVLIEKQLPQVQIVEGVCEKN